jgi:hypothetical protein
VAVARRRVFVNLIHRSLRILSSRFSSSRLLFFVLCFGLTKKDAEAGCPTTSTEDSSPSASSHACRHAPGHPRASLAWRQVGEEGRARVCVRRVRRVSHVLPRSRSFAVTLKAFHIECAAPAKQKCRSNPSPSHAMSAMGEARRRRGRCAADARVRRRLLPSRTRKKPRGTSS